MVPSTSSGTFSSQRTRRFSDSAETSPVVEPVPKDETEEVPETRLARETAARVNRHEKGDLFAKDRTVTSATDDAVSIATQKAADARKAIAREIGDAAKRAVSSHGSVKLTTALQLLRRSLSRAHDVIGNCKSEADFLSIVVLAETAINGKKWSELSKDVLQKIKAVAEGGEKQERVTYDDFNQVFRLLNASGLVSGPVLDFDEPDENDVESQE
jgi:hypothetical protein